MFSAPPCLGEVVLSPPPLLGELLGPASDVKTGPGRNASEQSEALGKDLRHELRRLAWWNDENVRGRQVRALELGSVLI